MGITGTIGLAAAIFPSLWLTLFTHDAEVLARRRHLSADRRPVYGLFGFGFVISFAGQGAGRVLWPSVAVTRAPDRWPAAAGSRWHIFGGGMATLATIVALSFVAYAASPRW